MESKAFAWGVITAASDGIDLPRCVMSQVCFTRKKAADAPIGVLDAAFLPRAMWVAEESIAPEDIAQGVVVGELGAVVLGQAAAQLRWQE
jgi:hypothetical protein